MTDKIYLHYSGGKNEQGNEEPIWQPRIGEIVQEKIGNGIQERRFDPYLPSQDLIEAVNLAIKLKRPLLLEGEPGCGKTRLADAIAYEFTQKNLTNPKENKRFWPYHIWNVKSVGRARDGLYTFDAILRLRDAQMMGSNFAEVSKLDPTEAQAIKDRLSNKAKYMTYGPLGKALLQDEDYRSILLIDEIDKADSDFPNDLLSELDRMGFDVPELNQPFQQAKSEPIVIITSNQERPLPEPFLRRCLYFYVRFPDDELLPKILECRFIDRLTVESDLTQQVLKKVSEIRRLLDRIPGSKPPGTSEIIDFLEALLLQSPEKSQEVLENLASKLPYLGILLKTQADQQLYRKDRGIKDDA
jgi:MoxR-like ATPase